MAAKAQSGTEKTISQAEHRFRNPDSEYGGRMVRTMTRLKNGKLLCSGKGCHSVYEARDVIDPANEDYRLWVGST